MILTQLEGKVPLENWEALKQAFRAGIEKPLPPYIYRTYLVQDNADKDVWRIMTIWHSRQALQEYRASVETPGGILMFRSAGTEPTLTLFEVVDRAG